MATYSYQCGDIVVVPFPFTDRQAVKRRPAVVLSSNRRFSSGHSVLAMITSAVNAPWPLDVPITDRCKSGLAGCICYSYEAVYFGRPVLVLLPPAIAAGLQSRWRN